MGLYPPGQIMPYGAKLLTQGIDENIWYTSPGGTATATGITAGQSQFYLAGAARSWPGVTDGMVMPGGLKGMSPNFKHLDLKGARQAGVTWTGTVYDAMEIDCVLEAHARTPQGLSALSSEWVGSWDPTQRGTLEHWTLDGGYWFCNPRLHSVWADQPKKSPRRLLYRKFTHAMRVDDAFWKSIDSINTFQPGVANASTFMMLSNIGTQVAYPRFLCYAGTSDGATFSFSNGPSGAPGSTNMITFGPLKAGQIVLLTTEDRLRGVVDLTPNQVLTGSQTSQNFMQQLISLAFNNNTPPLLAWFESLFGILPPQGPLYALLQGRWTNGMSGVARPSWAQPQYYTVQISGGNAATKVIGSVTPLRTWPEGN